MTAASTISDTDQLPGGVWSAIVTDVRGGIVDPLVLASRHSISADRAERAVKTLGAKLAKVSKAARSQKMWGRR